MHPISHQYISSKLKKRYDATTAIALCQCMICGTVQLERTADIETYKIIFPWVKQREPEEHLDDLVQIIMGLPGVGINSSIWGLSYKDKTTIDRFKILGLKNCRTLDYSGNSLPKEQKSNIVLIQDLITRSSVIKDQIEIHGQPDVVVCRHLFEHAHKPADFLKILKDLTSNGSYIVVEIPGNNRLIKNYDYTMPWEEHILYFTETSFTNTINISKMKLVLNYVYPYKYEDCIISILSKGKSNNEIATLEAKLMDDLEAFNSYSESFDSIKNKIYSNIYRYVEKGKKVAIYGSGHFASMFINTFGIDHLIKYIIDDDPDKNELQMPGNHLPIYSSDKLFTGEIDICLMAMSHTNEEKVIQNNKRFLNSGGQFISISPMSNNSIYQQKSL